MLRCWWSSISREFYCLCFLGQSWLFEVVDGDNRITSGLNQWSFHSLKSRHTQPPLFSVCDHLSSVSLVLSKCPVSHFFRPLVIRSPTDAHVQLHVLKMLPIPCVWCVHPTPLTTHPPQKKKKHESLQCHFSFRFVSKSQYLCYGHHYSPAHIALISFNERPLFPPPSHPLYG